ncbi:PCC domain-containing protein [Limosilactobacillus reuteri]|uniref:PPC domain-containing protein n=1 Tax=Limosilactobacillus reuteri TaxID=1598 RepID=A0A2T5Q4R9_LIMRT|nr:hypothetical protein DB325_03765 [Limosilactobacillus reuteri]
MYLRIDKGEEILDSILLTCKKYEISSATFYGLGACGKAVIGTYIPEKHDFLLHTKEGMLELVSLMGKFTLMPCFPISILRVMILSILGGTYR